MVLKMTEEELLHGASFFVIVGDLNFAQSSWTDIRSVCPYETFLPEILPEMDFIGFLQESKKQLYGFLTDAQQIEFTASEDNEMIVSYSVKNKKCSDLFAYTSEILCFITDTFLDTNVTKCFCRARTGKQWLPM